MYTYSEAIRWLAVRLRICRGESQREIADMLQMSTRTVRRVRPVPLPVNRPLTLC